MKITNFRLEIDLKKNTLAGVKKFFEGNLILIILFILTFLSVMSFLVYFENGLGLAYNDARSHLNIGRRVVEGLKPGLAQLGSVWLPLPHILMVPTVWNDFMWHTGLAGALQSMGAFVVTGILIVLYLKKIKVGFLGSLAGLLVFVTNINILYMQSTAMTELLLLATMLGGVYELFIWYTNDDIRNLIKSSLWIMLSTLIRYEGWFLLAFTSVLVLFQVFRKKGYKASEAMFLFFCSLAGFGVMLWLLWNLLIFKDPFYFAFGPYSAHAQQSQLNEAGVLATKGNLFLSLKFYFYALAYNTGAFTLLTGLAGFIVFWLDRKIKIDVKVVSLALLAPFMFNVLALYQGHSVLFIQGLSGDTWFNVRYGLMMMPAVAIFIGYLVHKAGAMRYAIIGLLIFVTAFAFINEDAVTLDDARVGASQKNVSEVSGWLQKNTKNKDGFILIAAASHDAVIFSSRLPMSKFIHEGTGAYWKSATKTPDRWARWIVMRTHDNNDQTYKLVSKSKALGKYKLVGKYPFADIYELKSEYISQLQTKPVLGKQR
jgi:hypothetical protein